MALVLDTINGNKVKSNNEHCIVPAIANDVSLRKSAPTRVTKISKPSKVIKEKSIDPKKAEKKRFANAIKSREKRARRKQFEMGLSSKVAALRLEKGALLADHRQLLAAVRQAHTIALETERQFLIRGQSMVHELDRLSVLPSLIGVQPGIGSPLRNVALMPGVSGHSLSDVEILRLAGLLAAPPGSGVRLLPYKP